MRKKVLSLMLTSAMVVSLAACGSKENKANNKAEDNTATPAAEETTTPEATPEATEAPTEAAAADGKVDCTVKGKIALITDSGDITDESFNQTTWEGVCDFGDANGIEYNYYKPAEDTDEERINSIDMAVSEGATVVVLPGYLFGPALAECQDTYPDVDFIAIDVGAADLGEGVELKSNAYACTFMEEQAGYLAGYAAVKDGYTKLGFLGGMAVPAVIRYGYGYVQGVNAAAEELGKDVEVKYTYGGQFYGDASITAKMESWYEQGTEIVFACGGGIWSSPLEAALNYNGMIIGVDVDQFYIGKGKAYNPVLTSAMKGLRSTVTDKLVAYFTGNWDTIGGKMDKLGLADGDYIGLPTAQESWAFKTFTQDEYQSVLGQIKDGSISISNDVENKPEVGSHTTVSYIE